MEKPFWSIWFFLWDHFLDFRRQVYTSWINRQLVGKRVIQQGNCDIYGFCGAYGSCDSNKLPICSYLRGFERRNREELNRQNRTSGCVRREATAVWESLPVFNFENIATATNYLNLANKLGQDGFGSVYKEP